MSDSKDKQDRNLPESMIQNVTEVTTKLGHDQGKPRVPNMEKAVIRWQPPKNGTTPANRK